MTNELWQDKIDQATVLSELARSCWARGEYEKAHEHLLESLKILEAQFGAHHIPLVRVLHSLGLLARVRGKYEESEHYYSRALTICQVLLGPSALGTATRMNYLAGLYNAQCQYEKAEALLLKSLSIYKSQLGQTNKAVALMLMALTILSKRQGKDAQANEYRQEMKLLHSKLELENDDVKTALSKLADFFYSQGRLDDADLVFRYGIILGEEQEFPQDPFVAESLLGLARLYSDYEAFEESAALYKRAMEAWQKLKGESSPESIAAMKECAVVMKQMNKHDEAARLEKKAASIAG
ncbi:MAG: tetratricopeptide repeat protein [Candidatus Obscuribacterales bacterium]|nr:tetratricopeptide repeat protein [Candidatus Obscuribacterales bacterium]